ncbi:MAG TPA: hypothetical protein VN669_06520 [Candidatus Acidoferrales bacterium]|jgi:hypothetical protein|nr:hypothetical protein [Candidatus Acidoferrales bacterium]
MRRLRLLVLLGVVLAVGVTAQAKTKNTASTPDQKQEQNSKDQASNNDGHRKHWWSLPHLHHKNADAKQKTNAKQKTDAKRQAEPTVKVEDPLIEANAKPKTSGPATAKTSSHASHGAKTARTAAATHKFTAHTRQAHTTMASRKPATKRVAASHNSKTAHHTCSAEEASKGGCQSAKRHTQKPVVRPAAAF